MNHVRVSAIAASIAPPTPQRRRLPCIALIAVLATGCGREATVATPPAPTIEGTRIRFADASPQLRALRSEPADATPAGQLLLPARLAWDDTRTSYLRAPLAGQVAALVAVPGDKVKAGQTLAWIASPEFGQIQAEGARGDAELRQSQHELARVRELHGAGIASGRELDEAETALAASRAEHARTHALARALGNGDRIDQRLPLRAPLAGVLVERNMSPGMAVAPDGEGRPLAVVSDPDHLWLLLDVPEHLAGRVLAGQAVTLTAADGATLATTLEHVADYVDPETRVIRARAQVDNSARRFKAGQYLRARVDVPIAEGVSVPADSVLLIEGQRVVFVDDGQGTFHRQPVSAEDIGEGRTWISRGLKQGDRVVVDGGLLLQQLLDQQAGTAAGAGKAQGAP